MKTFLLLTLMISCELGIACSSMPKSFCKTHAERLNDPVIKGRVMAHGTHSIQLEVLEVLYGTETRSVITVWDDQDFDCNGPMSMKASDMAPVGDTILAILPLINGFTFSWDVVGDYRRPDWFQFQSVLRVRNDSLVGLIVSGYPTQFWRLEIMKYSDFRNYWTAHQNDCVSLVGMEQAVSALPLSMLQEGSLIKIQVPQHVEYDVRLFTLQGQLITGQQGSGEMELDMQNQAAGIYLLTVRDQQGREYREKIIR